MATQQFTFNNGIADDAALRTIVAAIRDKLVAAGATLTTDTGQINTATVTKSASPSTIAGYNVFKFDDDLQADAPVFIKLDYGTGPTATLLNLGVTVGSGTDGAGTITGQVGTRQQMPTSTGASSCTAYVCCSDSHIGFHAGPSSSAVFSFHVGRTRSADGELTDDGVFVFTCPSVTGSKAQLIPRTGTVPAVQNTSACFGNVQSFGVSATVTDVAVGSMPAPISGKWRYFLGLLYNSADATAFAEFTADFLGEEHTFMPLGVSTSVGASGAQMGAGSGTAFAMLWE